MMKNNSVLFYSSVKDKKLFYIQRFYNTDIEILQKLGYEVILSNKITDAWKFWKYDWVFAYFYRYSLFVAIIAKLFGKNTYLTGGIDALDKNSVLERDYKLQKLLFRLCYHFSKSCIIVSKTDYENVRRIVDGKKLSYSEHTINSAHFDCAIADKENMVSTIVWQESKGNVQRKGVDTALKVFAELRKAPQYKDYKFIIMGKMGVGSSYLKDIIEELGIVEYVKFTDNIAEEEKIDYLKRSRIYFQLSRFEGFGVAALEALCAKNIVVHSGRGGLSNPVYHDGILVDIDSPVEIMAETLKADLLAFNNSCLEAAHANVCHRYDDERRKTDFARIIEQN